VRKGEKGIGILAPLTYRREDATTGEVVSGVRGYRSVAVFDVSQTDGEPLPDLDVPDLSGDDDGLLDALTALSGALGVTVEQRLLDPNGPKGWFSPGSRSIVVGSNFAALQQAKTLAHELGHALDPGLDADHNPTTREAVAEGVAYVVATSYGLTVDDYSFGYIASWAGSGDGRKVLQGVLGRIQKAAHRVFEAMGATGQDELDEAA
jgi:antirestriction protein ArdC